MKKIFVLDTSVIAHDWEALFSFEENTVVLPIETIVELDKLKRGNEQVNFNAREALRTIEAMPSKMVFNGGYPLGDGLGVLRIVKGFAYHGEVKKSFSEQSMDHRILNVAYCLANTTTKKGRESEGEIVLVSKDVNLRIKAGALNLKAEDYKNDIIPNSNSYYEKVKDIDVSKEDIDNLYLNNDTGNYCKADLFENEFVFLNAQSTSAMAFYKNEKLHVIKKDSFTPFGVRARNAEQHFALQALLDPEISLMTIAGKAGTGKTLLAIAAGLQLLKEGVYDKIYFTREAIGLSNKDLGFLPGDANDKILPYMKGLYDNLEVIKHINIKWNDFIIKAQKDEKLIIEPLAFIRGRSIPRTFFIIDETQNNSRNEIKSITTRAGEGTKIVLIGDVTQIDSPYLDQASNGLTHVISRMRGQKIYSHVTLLKGERSYLAEITANLL